MPMVREFRFYYSAGVMLLLARLVFSPLFLPMYRWAIFGLSIISFVFASVAVGYCSFMLQGFEGESKTGLGHYSAEFGDGCLKYDKDINESPFEGADQAARAFATMAALFTGFSMMMVVCMQCFLTKALKPLWWTVRILLVSSFFSQCFSFILFASDRCDNSSDNFGCSLGGAGIVAVLNLFVLVALIVFSIMVPPPQHPFLVVRWHQEERQATVSGYQSNVAAAPGDQDDTKITVVEGPDGTRTTTKEITHPDGSVTVTTTVEEAVP